MWLETAPALSKALADGNVTVEEAIDITATAAKAVARQKGIAHRVIATMHHPDPPAAE
ncbi:MAG: hypothetical protein OXC08_18880 [Thiotrichales bacterium]|nr:hypothetical protein [Thiotrichales bacterium]